jgi:hypothetical protein
MMKKNILYSILIIFLLSVTSADAQYGYNDRLRLEFAPYVWMTTLNGDLTIDGSTRKVNFTFDDFFKYSNLGLSGHVELKKNKWALIFDWLYVDLIKDPTYTELSLGEISLAIRLSENLEIIGGGRYFKAEVEFIGEAEDQGKDEKSWIDPIIGGRFTMDLTKYLMFTFRADVGGFGIGSKLQWNIASGIGYQLSNITFMAAYRIWYANYESGSGESLFMYDMTTSGPGLTMIIHF